MEEIDTLINLIDEENERNGYRNSNCQDYVPYVRFLQHFKEIDGWDRFINDVNSPFMKLLQIESLFYFKKKISKVEVIQDEFKTVQENPFGAGSYYDEV